VWWGGQQGEGNAWGKKLLLRDRIDEKGHLLIGKVVFHSSGGGRDERKGETVPKTGAGHRG